MTILRGRAFTAADNETTAPVAIVNQAFVKRFFKSGEDPLDQHFGLDLPRERRHLPHRRRRARREVRGLGLEPAGASHVLSCRSRRMSITRQDMMKRIELALAFHRRHHAGDQAPARRARAAADKTLAELDPNLTIISVRTMQQQVDLSFDQERAVASLAGLFGIVALLLAAVGLYGVTAYTVAQRTNEIGIRMALGADRAKMVQLVLRGAFQRVLIGLVLGLPLAIGAGRLISAQLYGVSSWDPLALTVAAGALAICAFFAAIIPASRAASISPMNALRIE